MLLKLLMFFNDLLSQVLVLDLGGLLGWYKDNLLVSRVRYLLQLMVQYLLLYGQYHLFGWCGGLSTYALTPTYIMCTVAGFDKIIQSSLLLAVFGSGGYNNVQYCIASVLMVVKLSVTLIEFSFGFVWTCLQLSQLNAVLSLTEILLMLLVPGLMQ